MSHKKGHPTLFAAAYPHGLHCAAEDIQRMLRTLEEAGFRRPALLPGLGFSVSACGMLIGFKRLNAVAQAVAQHKSAQGPIFTDAWCIATPEAVADIKVHVPPGDVIWEPLIRASLNELNNTGPDSGAHLRFVPTAAQADTVVHVIDDPTLDLSYAALPNNGEVGTDLYVNIHHYETYGALVYKNAIVHNACHTLGLPHCGGTDPSSGRPGQPVPDVCESHNPLAVMAIVEHEWVGWSRDELIAFAYLFPRNRHTTG